MTKSAVGKLYGPPSATKVMRSLVIADLNGIELETTPGFEIMKDTKTPEYLKKFPLGQSPGFESKDGFLLSESSAISLHIAALNKDTTLFGSTLEERSKIFQYIFNNETQLDRHSSTIVYPIFGFGKRDQETEDTAYSNLDHVLQFYDNELASRDYLVGKELTLADIFLFFSLFYPYTVFLSDERKTKFVNVTKFYQRLSQLDAFTKVLHAAK